MQLSAKREQEKHYSAVRARLYSPKKFKAKEGDKPYFIAVTPRPFEPVKLEKQIAIPGVSFPPANHVVPKARKPRTRFKSAIPNPPRDILRLEEYTPNRVNFRDVMRAVFKVSGYPPKEIVSPTRLRSIAKWRQAAIFTLRKHGSLSFPQIGRCFDRDHSSVMHSCQTVANRMGDFHSMIRAIEKELRIGIPGK